MSEPTPRSVAAMAARALRRWEDDVQLRASRIAWTPEALAAYAAHHWYRSTRQTVAWGSDPRWHRASAEVVRRAWALTTDPRLWVVATLYPHAVVAREKPWRVSPGHLINAQAERTVLHWVRHHPVMRWLDPEGQALLGAEVEFATELLTGDDGVRAVERMIQAERPGWSLEQTEGLPHVRLGALRAALEEVAPGLSRRFPAPAGRWRWIDVLAQVRAWIAKEEADRQKAERSRCEPRLDDDWDPDLGPAPLSQKSLAVHCL